MTTQIENQIAPAKIYFDAFVKSEQNLAKRQTTAWRKNPELLRLIAVAVHYCDNDSQTFCDKKNKMVTDTKYRRELYRTSGVGDIEFLLDRDCRNDLKAFRTVGENSQYTDNYILAICENSQAKGAHGLLQAETKMLKAIEKEFLSLSDNDSTDSDSDSDTDSDSTDTEPQAEMSQAEIIEAEFSAMLAKLKSQGISPADFWDHTASDNMDKITTEAQAEFLKIAS